MIAAYQSLATLARDDKYLGSGNIGATAVLHTWGRDMNYHPHVHMIVPGVALIQNPEPAFRMVVPTAGSKIADLRIVQ